MQKVINDSERRSEKPPKSTLSYGSRTVNGVPGTYCWETRSAGGSVDTCLDGSISVPRGSRTLVVPEGAELVFDFGGKRGPGSVSATAYPLRLVKRGDVLEGETFKILRQGSRVVIPAGLAPGEYVVDVFIQAPRGDASYYYRVLVEAASREQTEKGKPLEVYGSKNDEPVLGVVGMQVEAACRKLDKVGHAGEVSFVRRVEGVRPGRVVAQDIEPGTNKGASMLVYLIVSGPFSEKELPPKTACANPEPDVDDVRTGR